MISYSPGPYCAGSCATQLSPRRIVPVHWLVPGEGRPPLWKAMPSERPDWSLVKWMNTCRSFGAGSWACQVVMSLKRRSPRYSTLSAWGRIASWPSGPKPRALKYHRAGPRDCSTTVPPILSMLDSISPLTA